MFWGGWAALLHALRRAQEKTENGQGLVEYAMILVLVVIVVMILLTMLGPWVGNVYSNIINTL